MTYLEIALALVLCKLVHYLIAMFTHRDIKKIDYFSLRLILLSNWFKRKIV